MKPDAAGRTSPASAISQQWVPPASNVPITVKAHGLVVHVHSLAMPAGYESVSKTDQGQPSRPTGPRRQAMASAMAATSRGRERDKPVTRSTVCNRFRTVLR